MFLSLMISVDMVCLNCFVFVFLTADEQNVIYCNTKRRKAPNFPALIGVA